MKDNMDKLMKKANRFVITKNILLFWCLFIGIGAVAGATGMLSDPSGKAMKMDAMLPYFQVLPFAELLFQNFVFSGFSLLIVNGLTNLTASILIILKKKIGIVLGGIFGITLMMWIIIQFVIFPMNFMSTIYFIFGMCQAITGFIAYVSLKQEQFEFNVENYPNISEDSKTLVVYFSRMGYSKKIAYEKANKIGAEIYEVKTTEKIEGNLGFWWCGRFGMHKWEMPIHTISCDLEKYEKVIIVSPIWVFNLCGPMRAFCKQASGKVKAVDCILVHHMKKDFISASDEIGQLLKVKCENIENVCCRCGVYKKSTFKKQIV